MYTISRHLTKSGNQSPNWNVLDSLGALVTRCTSKLQALSLLQHLNGNPTNTYERTTLSDRSNFSDNRTEPLQQSSQSVDIKSTSTDSASGEQSDSSSATFAHCVVDFEDPRDAMEFEKNQGEFIESITERCREKNTQSNIQLPRFISDLTARTQRGLAKLGELQAEQRFLSAEQRVISAEQRVISAEQRVITERAFDIAEKAIRVAECSNRVDVGTTNRGEEKRVLESVRRVRRIEEI